MSTSHQATPGGPTGYGDTAQRSTAGTSGWSLLEIAINVFVIWALCSYDREAAGR